MSDENDPTASGNDDIRWQKLLETLDAKFQLGLLEKLRNVASYHLDGATLFIEFHNSSDREYFQKASVQTQLAIFASDAINVTEIVYK